MGEERIGPYRVAESLGAGGMGEVFKAFDETLGRWVAIKRIRTDRLEAADDNRERLRREARAVARLNHPAIVQVYHVFQDGDSDCIVMEFAEGETLDRLLARGRLSPRHAATIARDVAHGLAEAHAKGVVHRDLKTENVVVTAEGQAKILDFGLAKPVDVVGLDSVLTGKGQLVGTSRAMAPEYVGGGEVDGRADLFALGVLLYELLTGDSPFRAHNTLATLKKVMLHRPPPLVELNSAVPPTLSSLVERLLAKDPDDRPTSAKVVAHELEAVLTGLSSEEIAWPLVVPSPAAPPPLATTKAIRAPVKLWAVGLGLLSLVALAVAGYLAFGSSEFSFGARDRIVIGDFAATTGDAEIDDSLATAFRLGLEQSRYAVVVPASQIRDVLVRMQRDETSPIDRELGIEICLREGARALVLGSVIEVGGAYSLSAEIVDPETGASVFTVPPVAAGSRDNLLGALEEVTQLVRRHLGESLQALTRDTRPLEKVTTRDLRALQRYSRGLAELAEARYDESIALLQSAVELDPEFAMAHARLGLLYNSLGRGGGRARAHFERALASSDRLTEFERLYVEGWLATLEGTPDRMAERWAALAALFPEEVEGHHNLGVVRWLYQNRFADAAAAFADAASVRSGRQRPQALGHRGYCLLALGRNDDAIASLDEAWRLERSHVTLGLADAWAAVGRTPEAEVLLGGLGEESETTQREARQRLALIEADAGRFRRGLELLRPIETRARGEGVGHRALLVELGILAFLDAQGDRQALAREVEEAAPRVENQALAERAMDIQAVPMLAVFGRFAARAGLLDLAQSCDVRIGELLVTADVPLWRGYRGMLRGEIALADGRAAEAVDVLATAVSEADAFALHDSFARALETAGDTAAALAQNGWIVERRGRAFAECFEGCGVREANVLAWTRALDRLATLHAKRGEGMAARVALERLRRHLATADDPAVLESIDARLAALPPAAPVG